jgi:hypothetical protein
VTFPPAHPGKTNRMARRYGGNPAAVIILIAADIAALILILWIFFFVFDANRANDLVNWVHHSANWLAAWSKDLFTVDNDKWRTTLNYGLPAVIYLLVAHAIAGRVNRA